MSAENEKRAEEIWDAIERFTGKEDWIDDYLKYLAEQLDHAEARGREIQWPSEGEIDIASSEHILSLDQGISDRPWHDFEAGARWMRERVEGNK